MSDTRPLPTSPTQELPLPAIDISPQEIAELLAAMGSGQGLDETFAKLLSVHSGKAQGLGAQAPHVTQATSRFKAILLRELSSGEAPEEGYRNAVKAFWNEIHLSLTPEPPATEAGQLLAVLAGDQESPSLEQWLAQAAPSPHGDGHTVPFTRLLGQNMLDALADGADSRTALKEAQAATSSAMALLGATHEADAGANSFLERFSRGLAEGETLDALFADWIGTRDAGGDSGSDIGAEIFQSALLETLEGGARMEDALQQAATVSREAVTRENELQGPLPPAMSVLAALSSGENIQGSLAVLGGGEAGAESFADALMTALAAGESMHAAQAVAMKSVAASREAASATHAGVDSPMGALLLAMANGGSMEGALNGMPGLMTGNGAVLFQNVLTEMIQAGRSPLQALENAVAAPQAVAALGSSLQQPVTSEAALLMTAMASGQNLDQALVNLPAGNAFAETLGETIQSGSSIAQAMNEAKAMAESIAQTLSTLQSDQVDHTLVAMATGQGVEQVSDIAAFVAMAEQTARTAEPVRAEPPPSVPVVTPPAVIPPAVVVETRPADPGSAVVLVPVVSVVPPPLPEPLPPVAVPVPVSLVEAAPRPANVVVVNTAPVDLLLSNHAVAENQPGAVIGVLSGVDPDSGAGLSYALVGDPSGWFEVVDATLALKADQALDFESANSHVVRLQVTDSAGASFQKSFTVGVTDINEAPAQMALSSRTLQENSAGATVGTLSVTDPDAGDRVTWELVTDNAGVFELVGAELRLKTGVAVDYESASEHEVRLRATDQGGATLEAAFTLSVTNLNEAPTEVTLAAAQVTENQAGATIGTFVVADPDPGDAATLTLVADSGGLFILDGHTLKLQAGRATDYESASTHTLRIRATDEGNATLERSVTITVVDVNEAPTEIVLSSRTIPEKSAGAVVGTLAAIDPDGGDRVTFELIQDPSGLFAISGTTLKLASGAVADAALAVSHLVRVRATDSLGASLEKEWTLTVTDVNDAPTDITLSAVTLAENSAGAVVGLLSATDPDLDDTVSFSLVNDAGGLFVLTAGQLALKEEVSLDFESAASHTVRVQALDRGGFAFEKSFVIGVADVNESPTGVSLSSTLVSATRTGAVVGELTVSDPDVGDAATFALISDPMGLFEIVGETLKLQEGQSAQIQGATSHRLGVRVTDGAQHTFDTEFDIEVTDLQNPPTDIQLSASSVVENQAGATVGVLSVVDPDPDATATLSLIADPSGLFQIEGDRLQLKPDAAANFENAEHLTIRVRATDNTQASFEKNITLSVADLNERPTEITLSSTRVTENQAGALVGTLASVDPDAGDAATFALVEDDAGLFTVEGVELRVKSGSALNFEQASSHVVRIQVTDAAGLSLEKQWNLVVTDLNEAPTALTLSNAVVQENNPGATVGRVSVVDPDAGDGVVLSLVSDPSGLFELAGDAVRLRADKAVDYEAATSHLVRLLATDNAGATFEQSLTVTVGNINEAPTGITLTNTSVAENSIGEVVGRLSVVDPDANDGVVFSLVEEAAGAGTGTFTLVGDTLRLKADQAVNFESASSHTVRVRATDTAGESVEQAFEIRVNDVNEAPGGLSVSASTVAENSAGAIVGTLIALDPDAGDTVVFSLAANPGGWFVVEGDRLRLASGMAFDFEAGSGRTVRVRATDLAGASTEQDLVITVTDVNEAPNDLFLSGSTVAENTPGAVVGTLSATDPDPGDGVSFALVSDAGGLFEMVDDNRLRLKPDALVNFEGDDTLPVVVRVTDSGGLTLEKSFSITVTNVNDPPTATELSTPETFAEGVASLVLTPIVVSDPDSAHVVVTLTLASAAVGTLSVATAGKVTSTFDGVTWVANGLVEDVNRLLSQVTFTPAADWDRSFTIATLVSDGSMALQGLKRITVASANDLPVAGGAVTVTDTLGGEVTIVEDGPSPSQANIRLTPAILFDPDFGQMPAEIRILSVIGGSVTRGQDGSAIVLGAAGTRLALNQGHVELRFTPDANRESAAILEYVVVDAGNATLNSPASTATIAIQAANDAPTLTLPGNPDRFTEDGSALNLGNIVVGDEDGNAQLTVSVTLDDAAAGTLSVATSGSARATFANGVWSASGAVADLNTLLAGMMFTPGADWSRDVAFTVALSDGVAAPVTAVHVARVTMVNDPPTGSVTISGAPTQGQTLTASHTLTDGDGMGTVQYQWNADGSAIAGATLASLVLSEAMVGKTITVTASYTDGQGTGESVTSGVTGVVANVNDGVTGNFSIGGIAIQGQTLTATHTLVDADGLGSVGYQWRADGVVIVGVTGATLLLTESQVGKAVTVTASYTDGHGTVETITSSATDTVANVNDAPTGGVVISGTASQGQTLTVAHTLADADGLGSVRYQWRADGAAIANAMESTFVLTESQVGKAVTVTASYTDGHG
ncbi:MAG: cadherin repeat domain-containing protein, partial [Magnetococcales bacterium]|nr:cadherin repeat domain-containing protein [Magnetococcales bacterium]